MRKQSALAGADSSAEGVVLTRHRFSVGDYHAMVRAGILDEDSRVELLDGEIVEMAPIGSRHAGCVNRLNRMFLHRLGNRIVLAPQNPLRLDGYSEPEPDIALLKPREDLYAEAHPTPSDTLLVVEVADTTLAKDRRIKLPLYARAGIAEVWLVNLEARELEVHREPAGDDYAEVRHESEGTVDLLAFPCEAMDIEEILGPCDTGRSVSGDDE